MNVVYAEKLMCLRIHVCTDSHEEERCSLHSR